MKTVGVIGGTGPESTIEYYRFIIASYRQRTGDGHAPSIIINSIDNKKLLDLIGEDRLQEVIEFLVEEIEKLSRAGADFGVLAANTTHIVFEPLRLRSSIPLVSIVEVTCQAAKAHGLQRLGSNTGSIRECNK